MDQPMLLELSLRRRLREAHALLDQLSGDTEESRFRYAVLGLLLQLGEDVAAGVVDLSLVEILDDTLHTLLDEGDPTNDAPMWVEAA
jgi:hypothetical protein